MRPGRLPPDHEEEQVARAKLREPPAPPFFWPAVPGQPAPDPVPVPSKRRAERKPERWR